MRRTLRNFKVGGLIAPQDWVSPIMWLYQSTNQVRTPLLGIISDLAHLYK